MRGVKERAGADYLITTEKDWVRSEKVFPGYKDMGYLTIRFTLLSGQESFFRMVKEEAGKRTGFRP